MTIAMRCTVSVWILCVVALLAAAADASGGSWFSVPHRMGLSAPWSGSEWRAAPSDNKECSQDADCDIRNSTCQQGVCQCVQGEIVTSDMTRCLAVATGWGAACEDTAQCSARLRSGGICEDHTCRCAEGFHYEKGRCWLSAGLGETCSRNERCYANYDAEAFSCQENKCQCAPGFYQREYTSCRRQSSAPGEECGINVDCHFKGAVCQDKICACPQNTTYDETKKECVPSGSGFVADESVKSANAFGATWNFFSSGSAYTDSKKRLPETREGTGKSCQSDSDCTKIRHSTCLGGQCVCDAGYFTAPPNAMCYPELLQTCNNDKECQVPESICREGAGGKVCSCKAGLVASEDRRICRKMSRFINWSCLHAEQCSYFGPWAECQNKKCQCGNGTHWEEEKQYCWKSVAIGGNCTAVEDCRGLRTGSENVICKESVCTCSDGYHSSADNMSCRKNTESIGDICEENEDCSLAHSACVEKKCACAPGYFESNSTTPVTCAPGINGECSVDSDCIVSSSCVSGKCKCQNGFVGTENGKECLKEVGEYEGVCEDTVQCSTTGSVCKQGKCTCSDDTHFRDGFCRVKKALGATCSRSSECFLEDDSGRTECRNGLCKCKYDFYNPLSQDCTSMSNAGEPCFIAIGSLVFWTILTRYL